MVSDIDPDWLRQEILADGADDYTGLYEIIWSLNTHYPAIDRAAKLAVARPILVDLVSRGELLLYTTRWASNHYELVPTEKAVALASSDESWDDPTDNPFVCYATP